MVPQSTKRWWVKPVFEVNREEGDEHEGGENRPGDTEFRGKRKNIPKRTSILTVS